MICMLVPRLTRPASAEVDAPRSTSQIELVEEGRHRDTTEQHHVPRRPGVETVGANVVWSTCSAVGIVRGAARGKRDRPQKSTAAEVT